MTRTIRLTLAYEGTRFSGWQSQPGRTTVQGTLAGAIREVSGEEVVPRGSSRTDAGVHALGQVVSFETTAEHDARTWVRAINARLPPDVTVVDGEEAAAGFDPVWGAVSKIYRYRIHDAPWRPVLARHLVWRWKSRLDLDAMLDAAAALVGGLPVKTATAASTPSAEPVTRDSAASSRTAAVAPRSAIPAATFWTRSAEGCGAGCGYLPL